MSRKWRALLWLALAELLAMSLWFSATAVVPALMRHWDVTGGQAAWLTMAVQLGFVVGALVSALLNVADLFTPKYVVATGALTGAALNLAIPLAEPPFAMAVMLRFGTGMMLALVYPVGMKIMATWTREDRGLGLGLLVGALTVGSAIPHLVRALGGIAAWQPVLYTASALAAAGGIIVWLAGEQGPYRAPVPKFRWRHMTQALRVRPLRLANAGYLGHMWELYAMWTWIPLFLAEAYRASGWDATLGTAAVERAASLASFTVIALGGAGSLLAGRLADRWGRTRTTILSMAISGGCALGIGGLFGAHPVALTVVALLWGFAIVADSAQFSTSISELAEPEYMGTQLTTQTSMGFLLTLASIQLVPPLVDWVGWQFAFASLALGPLCGSLAMWRLLRSPAAARLAGGRG